jgi:hypothetical protein
MITKMMKISLFVLVLAGISGQSGLKGVHADLCCGYGPDPDACPRCDGSPCCEEAFGRPKGVAAYRSSRRELDGEEDYAYAATSSASDDDIKNDDNVVEPDDNVDASGSDDNDASDIKKYLRAN